MKKTLSAILFLTTLNVNAQTLLTLKSGESFKIKKYFQSGNKFYFKKEDSTRIYYVTSLSLDDLPPGITTIPEKTPAMHLNEFKQEQLGGIWCSIIGVGVTSAGLYAESNPAAVGGGILSLIGFIVFVHSYSNIKRYYVVSDAKPYER